MEMGEMEVDEDEKETEPLQQRVASLALSEVLLRVGDGEVEPGEHRLGGEATLCTMHYTLYTIQCIVYTPGGRGVTMPKVT